MDATTRPAAPRTGPRYRPPRAGLASLTRQLAALAVLLAAATAGLAEEPRDPLVRTGLDRIAGGPTKPFGERRAGLVVHAASLTADGRHAIDVMADRGVDVVRLFSPEHGLRGRAAAGEKVSDGKDPVSGLPVVSLYGEKRRPEPDDLEGLDVLIFDLQGAGVRFYTYVSTLIHCLEAAAEAGIDFVVLDRPNPLGGDRVEGPVSAPRDRVPSSFVNLAPGPLVHGLTLGEMARFVNSGLDRPAELQVVAMEGWRRNMTWADTGLDWVPPSPNLRTPDAALAYPGTALIEATNLSEGRGTPSPFLLLGAPWLEPGEISVAAPGFALHQTTFTPQSSPAAPKPKHLDQECHGWRVEVTDRAIAEPYRLGVSLLAALQHHPDFEWRREGAALTWLTGTDRLLQALKEGKNVNQILTADHPDQDAWRQARRPALLYK